MPWSIALPMIAGITACATIHTMPNVTPPAIVAFWPFATHHR